MPGPAVIPGCFGKLPATGDFVARGLSPRARAWLDGWLSAHLAHRLPEGTALCFRLETPPGPLAGVVVASRDSVGRRFPLALAAEATPAPGAPWFADLREVAEAAIAERLSPDSLAARLATLGVVSAPDPGPALLLWLPEGPPTGTDPAALGPVLDQLFGPRVPV